jgi:two-component system, NtrC family, sensor kinase
VSVGHVDAIEALQVELETKKAELAQARAEQTATADVLKIIASSPSDLQLVFDAIAERSNRLIGGHSSGVFLFADDSVHMAAFTPVSPQADAALQASYPRPTASVLQFALTSDGKVVQIADVATDGNVPALAKQIAQVRGWRSALYLPLNTDKGPIGAINVNRKEPGEFSERDLQLLQTFADQAVIAIQNARLFEDVQAKTRDLKEALKYQTGTSNILSVIACSPTNVAPALDAIVNSACELCDAYDAYVLLKDGDSLRMGAHRGPVPIPLGQDRWPIHRNWVNGRAVVDKQAIHIHDLLSEGAEFSEGKEFARRLGHRTILSVPMLREGECIGTISLRRMEVQPFSEKQIALLQSFAHQAVIAIGNVALFEEVQARTKELAASLDNLRTAQDRLIQTEKLASLGQLTAGIAHEIKNPLNFVNNFSGLSAELIGELNGLLKDAALPDKIRAEVEELTGLLHDNLMKIVQHGKRADSIVKNMLLHSREGGGEQRSADVNRLVDETLSLAYYGARAENRGFNVTLQRDFDVDAGLIELFPQEITRALLNLISNGFYAATQRQKEDGGDGFIPVLSAATKNLGSTIEIRIRDNGIGIPPDVKEKMFNPFFTTKPPGEGTGLGLSITHDIIVKQHGGKIDVATAAGEFTEFTIVLPRSALKR